MAWRSAVIPELHLDFFASAEYHDWIYFMKPGIGLFVLIGVLLAATSPGYAQSQREQLTQWVQQLQATPQDGALREKIIALAAEIKPSPAVPKEARRPFVMADTFQKTAKTVDDFGAAIKAYEEALVLAPWWGDAYYNLSVSLESAGRFAEARLALKRYLLSKPADAEQVEDRLYAMEAKEAVTAKEKAKQAKTFIVPGVSIGSVRIGMTADEAIAALGAPTDRVDYDNNNGYRGVSMTWGVRPNTLYMDFYKYKTADFVTTGQTQHKTVEGVGAGMPVSEALALMGASSKSKNFGSTTQTCYARGVGLGIDAGSSKIDRVIVFTPATLNKICPD
jgi:tetratricopeptide (TPR) repeat protein